MIKIDVIYIIYILFKFKLFDLISDSNMEDSKECTNIKIVAESSDNNNTQNSSLGDEDSLKKEFFQTLYEIYTHKKDLQINELKKAVDDSSAREAQLLSENERMKKKLEELANPIDDEHNVPVLYQKPEDINEKLEDYIKDLVEKDKKIESLEKDRENLLKDSNRNQRLTFVHEILKKQKEEALEKSARLSSSVHQKDIIIVNLKRRLEELTEQLEKNKEEVLNLQAARNDDGAEETRKLLEDTKTENVELRAKNESLEKELTVFKDMKKSEEEKLAAEAELKMLYEESNNKNNKLQSHNETLRNRLKEKDEALKTSKAEAKNAWDRLNKHVKEKKTLQDKLEEKEVHLTKSKKEVKNLSDDLILKEDELEEEKRKLRELDDKFKTQTGSYHIEVRRLRAKIRNLELEVELDSIHHLDRNSDHYNTDDQLEIPRITFQNDSTDDSWETERLGENGRKRRRDEDYSESEDEKPRKSVFERLGRNKIKNK